MASFTGTLNIQLISLELDLTERKQVELFVSVDQAAIYQTSVKGRDVNESFTSRIQDGKEITFSLFNESPKSADDILAKCVISFDEILKKEKRNGIYEIQVDLMEQKGRLNFAAELIESSSGDESNRRSVIHKKVHQINGHKFKASLLEQPSFCSHCKEFIYGIGLQGYRCLSCDAVVHKRCHQAVETRCKNTQTPFVDEPKADASHEFEAHHFLWPTYCNHCGTMVYGLYKQGMQCKDCQLNVHKRCHQKVALNCNHKTGAIACN